jgi:hypothetical protein
MGLLTHREKLALFRHRLSEAQTQEEREEILRLIAAEEAARDGIIGVLFRNQKMLTDPK